jgi:hypothetical protein
MAIQLAVESIAFFMRNVHVRVPFRYGNACLLGSPLLHARLKARGADGRVVEGVSADALPPGWFDKDPSKTYRDNIADLIAVSKMGAQRYGECGGDLISPFDLWHDAYQKIQADAAAADLNKLTGSFGSSIIERAVLDAAGKLATTDLHTMLVRDDLGIVPERIHPELAGCAVAEAVGAAPSDELAIRHTVGLSDPIFDEDVATGDRVDDGLPESIEAWLDTTPIHFIKAKIFGEWERDADRLTRLAGLLAAKAPPDYAVSLDGNENFASAEELSAWWDGLAGAEELREFTRRIVYVEQPLARAVALSEDAAQGLRGMANVPPVIIDESDDTLHAFKESVALGYRGTSVKSCKGVIKGLLNMMLLNRLNEEEAGRYILTAEDLTTVPVVALQQDLCTMSVLGLRHVERNGHHYYRGLEHLAPSEVAQCLDVHRALYEPWGESGRLRIRDGKIDLRSLRQVGYGVGVAMDFESMTPLDDWGFESLGIDK